MIAKSWEELFSNVCDFISENLANPVTSKPFQDGNG